jgi:acyl-CoA thioesterase-1
LRFLCFQPDKDWGTVTLDQDVQRGRMMRLVGAMVMLVCLALLGTPAWAEIRIVAVGDSSFRGGPSMANPDDAFPARLEAALRAKGYDVSVANAGVNGEKSWETLRRLNTAVPAGTQIALLAVGGNDMVYQHAGRREVMGRIKEIVTALRARRIEVLVFGLGGQRSAETAAEETRELQALGAVVVPPMQAGLVDRNDLHVESTRTPQTTLWHLNRAGNDIVVGRTLPEIEKMIGRLRSGGS